MRWPLNIRETDLPYQDCITGCGRECGVRVNVQKMPRTPFDIPSCPNCSLLLRPEQMTVRHEQEPITVNYIEKE